MRALCGSDVELCGCVAPAGESGVAEVRVNDDRRASGWREKRGC